MRTRFIIILAVVLIIPSEACWGWLFDGGPAQQLGAMLQDGTNFAWAAAPFSVTTDSYATSFGAALGRAFGPLDAGFDVYLTTSSSNIPESAIAEWTIVPTTVNLDYYYVQPDSPIFYRRTNPTRWYLPRTRTRSPVRYPIRSRVTTAMAVRMVRTGPRCRMRFACEWTVTLFPNRRHLPS